MREVAESAAEVRAHLLRNVCEPASETERAVVPLLPLQDLNRQGGLPAQQLRPPPRHGQHQGRTRGQGHLQVLQAHVPGVLVDDQEQLEEA